MNDFPVVHAIFDHEIHFKNHIVNFHMKGTQLVNFFLHIVVRFNNKVTRFRCPYASQNPGCAIAIWLRVLPNDCPLIC